MQKETPRKMVFNLNHEASYDSGLICGGSLEIFVEPILPQPVVYLFGGGHVSMAVANAASAARIWDCGGGRSRDICECATISDGAGDSYQF